MLKLENNKICKLIFECDFIQRLDFSCCERNIPINTADVININKTKSKGLFIETFFSIFIWMLQFAVIAKLSFIADFFDSEDGDWFILNYCNSRIQIYGIIGGNRDSRSDRGCWNYDGGLGSWEVVVWSGGSFGFGRCSISSCNSMRLMMLKLL